MQSEKVCGMSVVGIILAVIALFTQPALGKQTQQLRRVRDILNYSTSATQLLVQQPELAVIKITGIKVNSTSTGIELILQTQTGEALKPVIKSESNSLIAEIPNAVLVLPEGKNEFRSDRPTKEIVSVVVTQVNANNIQIAVTGKQVYPKLNYLTVMRV
ncbi:MAG: AMIN domain-containing protein [Nostoc sp.]|uniref:AMIN domain-containing protein n=1 Tax=Nostoc sp. TaxID=1180 RepID=UPI002FFCDA68